MAAAVILPVVEVVIDKLGSAIWKDLSLLWGVEKDIQKLHRLLLTIRAVLDEAERRSPRDLALCNWLRDLKDAAFDVDDVMDEFQTELEQRRRIKKHSSMTRKVRKLVSNHNSFAFRFMMARKIKDVLRRLEEIAEEKKRFHLAERYTEDRRTERETYSFVIENQVYGRNGDKEKVIYFLTNEENDKVLEVLPIIGLGGVGKTTLVQLIYNDKRIIEHFDLQMWVCVAEDFNVKLVANAIVQSASKTKCKFSDFETIQQVLRQQLRDKRFLLVLDDIWNENAAEWERLKPLLLGCKEGSKIVVTTRSQIVARMMGTVATPYRLEVLSTDDCWIIFRQRAFGPGREEKTPNLVKIGKDIVSKCGGLPLAAKALGSLMAFKQGEAEWLAVKNSEIWKIPEGKDEILPTLMLSYDHLPPHLKQCFAYCSLFPKNYEIDRLKLIQLWMAEGFVQSSDEGIFAEDIGEQYFNSLLWRSFFQDVRKDQFGNILSCKMHDLVHNLACSIAHGESSVIACSTDKSFFHGFRYSSVICNDFFQPLILEVPNEAKKLRSLLLFAGNRYLSESALLNLSHLRALHLSGTRSRVVHNTIGKLKHLRFLDLSHTSIRALPNSITSLYNLQTLNLQNCTMLQILPEGLKNMSNLRHLDISQCNNMMHMPCGMGRLSKLQTLPLFIVGETSESTIAELQHLNLIRGELQIKCLRNVQNPVEATEAKLEEKANLQSLELYWNRDAGDTAVPSPASGNKVDVDVLENLQPHPNVRHLRLEGYDGDIYPNWLTSENAASTLPNLEKLLIYNLKRCEYLPPLGQLPSLKHLDVRFMNTTKIIGREFYGNAGVFSLLECLTLCRLPTLEKWSIPECNMFPLLKVLILEWCPKLTVEPHLPSSVVELKISSNSNEELLSAVGSLQGLTNLRSLCIVDIKSSKSGWQGLQYLSALQVLKIGYCEELTCLPEGILHQHLPCLQTLELVNNYSLLSLGEGRRKREPLLFSSLRHLIIRGCRSLTALPEWLVCLNSLQSLKISRCHNLAMLPDGLQQLITLQHLTIDCCHILDMRCQERGDDWHKIAHIPNIHLSK